MRPEHLVDAIRPWECEDDAHLTDLVSSPHVTGTGLYVIQWIGGGERPNSIAVEALRCRTDRLPRVRVVVPHQDCEFQAGFAQQL